jgi:hypothetical protein
MRIHRYAIGALFAATALAACEGADAPTEPGLQARVEDAGHNAAQHVSSTTQLDETIVNPCNGETIHLTGTLVEQANYVDKPENLENGNSVHGEHQGRITESGIGLTTGAAYDFRSSFRELFNSPSVPAANFEFTFHGTDRMTSSIPGLSFSVTTLLHVIGLPTGELKVTKDVENTVCR